jgi:carbon storage regulator CsrA
MLVLGRKVGEAIVVPSLAMRLTVVGVSGRTVRLGFAAPSEVEILRSELGNYRQKQTSLCHSSKEMTNAAE